MKKTELIYIAETELGPSTNGNGESYAWFHCPYHEDKTPSLSIERKPNPNYTQRFTCWSCNLRGDAIQLIRAIYTKMSFHEAAKYYRELQEKYKRNHPIDYRKFVKTQEEAKRLKKHREESNAIAETFVGILLGLAEAEEINVELI